MLAIFCFVLFRVLVCVCFSERTSNPIMHIFWGRMLKYLRYARSYMDNYVYYLVYLYFGIQLIICVWFIRIRSSGL